MYNFTVEDWHNYFVSDSSVLVHNANCNKKNKDQSSNNKKDESKQLKTNSQAKKAAEKLGFTLVKDENLNRIGD